MHNSGGPQQIVQITDSGLRWIVGTNAAIIILMLFLGAGLGYAIALSTMEREEYINAQTKMIIYQRTVDRTEAKVDALTGAKP